MPKIERSVASNIPVEMLSVDDQCVENLKLTGVETVEDILFVVEQFYLDSGFMGRARWLHCYGETVDQLLAMELLSGPKP